MFGKASSQRVGDISQEQYLYLTTRGRKSGRPREIEIWFTERDGCYYVIAEYDTSHWLQNLRADPDAQVRVAEKSFSARARVLTAENDAEILGEIRAFSSSKYGWGEGTVVELRPETSTKPAS
ncbi:MAG TPA: nitroreductase family deazaflavin-dependent oxidoreductase [Terriglobales bacterium]|nr:nitroreductase family deazaflavin-dependent oxidoreductase [Terriglobales bacterium]